MSESIIPDRQRELADSSYRMLKYTWFRIVGKDPELSFPHYAGQGIAFNPHYNIRDVWQAPMPNHVVIKASLSAGGAVAASPQHQVRPLKPGEVVLRFVEESEFWEGYEANHHGTWSFLGIILSGETAVTSARALIHRFGRVFDIGIDNPVLKSWLELVTEPNHVTQMDAAKGFRLCNELFSALFDAAAAAQTERSSHISNLAEAVEATIRKDLRRDWSVEDLAEQHNMSREHLTRVFTRRFGIPPRRYVTELRIREACRRLRTTNDSIKTIVHALGFQSQAAFVRTFRRFHDASPSEYRRRHGH